MKFIAINASPRKHGNTAELLGHAVRGAKDSGAETELIHLYDYDFKGCVSCFSCKLKNTKHSGKCAVKDGVTPVLNRLLEADAVVFGSPVYFGDVTASMRALIERLCFPLLVYDKDYSSLYKGVKKTGFIYTMNVDEQRVSQNGYNYIFETNKRYLSRIFGHSEYFIVTDTLQFKDYSKYEASAFDPEQKSKRHNEVFPRDCEKAYEMGREFIR